MTITASGLAGFTLWDAATSVVRSVGTVTSGRRVRVGVWYWSEAGDDPLSASDLTKTAGTATIGTITLDRQAGGDVGGSIHLRTAVFSVPITGNGTLTLTLAGLTSGSYGGIGTEEFAASGGWNDTPEATNGQFTATGSLTTYNSGNATSAGGALFFGALCWNTGAAAGLALSNAPPWVSVGIESDASSHEPGAVGYRIATTGVTDAATWTGSMTGDAFAGAAACVVVYKEAAASNVTVTPGAGALVLAGLAPTTLVNRITQPGVGALTLAGLAPSIIVNRITQPGVGALLLEGLAPTVTATDNRVAQPGAGALLLAGLQPSIATTDNRSAAPGAGALTLEGLAPSIVVDVRVAPGAGALVLLGLAPTVVATDNHVVEPGVGALALAGLQPTVAATDNHVVEPGAGALTLNGLQPAAVTGGNVVAQPDAAALVLAGLQPTVAVTDNRTAAPGAGALLLEGLAPTVAVTANIIVNPLTGALIFTGLEPTVAVTDNHVVEPGVGVLALAGLAPEIPVPSPVAEPGTGALVLEGLAPTVVTTGAESVATDPKLIARRPNVHIEGFGRKTPAPTPPPTPAPAQITNMPGHPPVPPPLNLGRGAVAEALAKIPESAPATRTSVAPAAPAPKLTAAPTSAPRVTSTPTYAPNPVEPRPGARPAPPALTQADIDRAVAAAQQALLARLEAAQAGADEVSNRLHERVESLAGEVERLATAFAEERAARAAAEQKARNQARAKAIAAKLLGNS